MTQTTGSGTSILVAAAAGTRVVPVLLEEARIPAPAELPEDIRFLSLKQSHPISDAGWERDADRLARSIEGGLPRSPSPWIGWNQVTWRVLAHSILAPWPLLGIGLAVAAMVWSEP